MSKFFAPFVFFAFLVTGFWSCRNVESTQKTPEVDFNRTTNEIVMAMRIEPDGLNPIITTVRHSTQITELIFQYLMDIDRTTLELKPQLVKNKAEVAEITEGPYAGGVAFTYEIHEEAVWDDGRPVTAHDFVFTVKAILNPKVQAPRLRPYISVVKDVQIDANNPKKFTVLTPQKTIDGEESVVWTAPVLPAHLYDPDNLLKNIPLADFTNPDKMDQLVETNDDLQSFAEAFNSAKFSREKDFISGSGPYEVVAWDAGQQLMLRRKDNWWGDKLPSGTSNLVAYPDTLTYVIIPEEETIVAALRAEEIDVTHQIGPENFEDAQVTEFIAERYQFETPPMLGHAFLYLNNNEAILSDKKVRRALAHLVNVDDILENIYLGYGQRSVMPILPESSYFNDELTPIDFNEEKAKLLLAEAGWTDSDGNGILDKEIDGEMMELKIPFLYGNNNRRAESVGLLIKDDAIKAGVEIEMTAEDPNKAIQRTKTGDYFMAWAAKGISPTLWNPKQLWHTNSTGGGDNRTGFGNAETDALIDELVVTLDAEKRNEMYRKLQGIIYDEQPVIFLFIPQSRLVVHKRFDFNTTPIVPNYYPSEMKLNLE